MSNVETENKGTITVVPTNPGFMQVDSIENAMKCANIIATSAFCPKGMTNKPGDIVIALQMGQELGLKPMQALQNIAVINGRPSLWGDAMLAVCRQSPDFEYIKEEYLEDTKTYVCRVKRRNEPEFLQRFSEADAKTARLWGKEGPWTQYPRRMLQMRARGFALRDSFPDLLRGIMTQEEAEDMPKERVDYSKNVGQVIDGHVVTADGTISHDQAATVRQLIKEAKKEEANVCKFLQVEKLEDMTVAQWVGVCKMLDKEIRKKQKNESLPINNLNNETTVAVDTREMTESAKEFFADCEEGE